MSVGFLRSFEIMQHAKRIVVRSGGQQSASVLDQVAGPDQVVAAQVLVTLVEAPWDGKTGNDSAEKILGLMGAQNGGAGPV